MKRIKKLPNFILKNIFDIIKTPISIFYIPKYLYYSVYLFEIKKMSTIEYKIPWINFSAIKYLKKIINKNNIVFEWGSGGSTLFFSEKVKKIISVEYNQTFYSLMKEKLDKKNTSLRMIKRNKNKTNYIEEIKKFPKNHFDIIVIDGRDRVKCCKIAKNFIKKGGFIIVDNMERERYKKIYSILTDFEKKEFLNFVPFCHIQRKTSFFRKIF